MLVYSYSTVIMCVFCAFVRAPCAQRTHTMPLTWCGKNIQRERERNMFIISCGMRRTVRVNFFCLTCCFRLAFYVNQWSRQQQQQLKIMNAKYQCLVCRAFAYAMRNDRTKCDSSAKRVQNGILVLRVAFATVYYVLPFAYSHKLWIHQSIFILLFHTHAALACSHWRVTKSIFKHLIEIRLTVERVQ